MAVLKVWLQKIKRVNSRLRSLYIVHLSMLIVALGASIIFTGVWPYIQEVSAKDGESFLRYSIVRYTENVFKFWIASDFKPFHAYICAVKPIPLGYLLLASGFFCLGDTLFNKKWISMKLIIKRECRNRNILKH